MSSILQEDGFYILQENNSKIFTEDLQNYIFSIEKASFLLTGIQAGLYRGYKVIISKGSFLLTANPIELFNSLGIWRKIKEKQTIWTEIDPVTTVYSSINDITTNYDSISDITTIWEKDNDMGVFLLMEEGNKLLKEDLTIIKIPEDLWEKIQ